MNPLIDRSQSAPVFVDNSVVTARPEAYTEIMVDARKVLADWKTSLLAHELLDKNGYVKGDEDISESRLEKRDIARKRLLSGEGLEKPVLGIGVFDNVEIGAGSDILAMLVMEGVFILPVHIRKSQMQDFEAFKV